jgi:hypothetical protein
LNFKDLFLSSLELFQMPMKRFPKKSLCCLQFLLFSIDLIAPVKGNTLHVGSSFPYPILEAAIADVLPGDTILVHAGTYNGGLYAENIQGTADAWITIMAVPGEAVIFDGGTNAWQFSDGAYLDIRGICI